jgi:uncharacterized protein
MLELKRDNTRNQNDACEAAVQRTLPLFLQVKDNDTYYDATTAASVPFVCRYRTDVIHPLTTEQVHLLLSMVGQHESLRNLRNKLLPHFGDEKKDKATTAIRAKILTSTSKTELEDLYAPFKPAPKGSILERIQSKHPELFDSIEKLWEDKSCNKANIDAVVHNWSKLGPRDAVVQVLGSKIATEPEITWWMMDELRKYCRVKTTVVAAKKKTTAAANAKKGKLENKSVGTSNSKYSEAYGDFSAHATSLKDHQVLAIRRGVQEKALKMAFDIDSDKMERHLLWRLRNSNNNYNSHTKSNSTDSSAGSSMVLPTALLRHRPDSLLKEAIHDAWSRLLRRRGTTRLWAEKCKDAQDRACQVFEDNLQRALLAPPYGIPVPRPVLALDPGFAAGIKCALLDSEGSVLKLDTVKFLGSEKTKKAAVAKLERMLHEMQSKLPPSSSLGKESGGKGGTKEEVTIALGNGHGSADSRELILAASTNCGIPLDIQLVSEAGASVWSVTKNAYAEFPDQPPAAVAAISIGRRLQNPLFELVKVPPKSLGLGMYQHDLSEKELDEKLHLKSVDAVAVVGVDVNSGSLEILEKVPGLSASLSRKIIGARPLKKRSDLLKISGLGPKAYENCAGFVRVSKGPEPLDDTLVHPESYDLARWLLKEFSWELNNSSNHDDTTIQHMRDEGNTYGKDSVAKAATKHNVSQERVLAVLDNLVDSMSNEDPRLKLLQNDSSYASSESTTSSSSTGLVASCKPLPAELSDMKRLSDLISEQGGPIRGIVGTIRNVADFGAFVDIGNENNGLLHVSKLGPNLQLQSLLIGQQIGVDILSVSPASARISVGLHGCNLQASAPRNNSGSRPPAPRSRVRGSSSSSSGKSMSGNKRSISTKTGGRTSTSRTSSGSQKKRRVKR